MGTLTEEIFSKKAGREVKAGEIVWIELDRIMSHDSMTPLVIEAMKKLSEKVFDQEKIVIVFDHLNPPSTIEHAKMQRKIIEFIKEQNLVNFYQDGVCHQVMIERGFVNPGDIIIGSDSHTCTYGALGAFSTGMGATDIGIAYATGKIWFRVPETILIRIKGKLPKKVYAKDIFLHIAGKLKADAFTYKAIEFQGEVINDMDISDRLTLSNMAVELGAKAGLIAPDKKTGKYLGRDISEIKPINPNYEDILDFDINNLEPQVSFPHDIDNVRPISDAEGITIDQVFIGTCTNGRFEDLEIAAKILSGKKIHRFTKTIITPASTIEYQKAEKAGFIKIFQDAGAIITNPSCGPCLGRHQGVLGPGEKALTTMNRNFKGRMGSPESEIFLASPATCAASALYGKITDPRKLSGDD